MSTLAIRGGKPIRTTPFPQYVTIGEEEKRAVAEVLDSGVLSRFLGTWSPDFYGGPRVQKLEREWEAYFGVRHAVSVNSATSGLNAAVAAAGVEAGDEVIVSPYTMTASACCALVNNAVPVFADIEPDTFCISARTIRNRLTPRTRAIVVVDIFGHPADMDGIMDLAREHNLTVIEDAAQAPGALYHGRHAGTLAHMGVFSLNYHKTIQCGEGGVIVTDDDRLAERLQLVRNHGETVVQGKGTPGADRLLGFNYRMTEIEAAIASEQLKKLQRLLMPRIEAANYLTEALQQLPGLTVPVVLPGVRHGYYFYVLRYSAQATGMPRRVFLEALQAEGVPVFGGYVEPLYWQPLYQRRGDSRYDRGACPVVERMHQHEVLLTNVCHASVTKADLDDVIRAFHKVSGNLHELSGLATVSARRTA